jgi:hypothetical protein
MSKNEDGYVVREFFKDFASNFKVATPTWLIMLAVGAFLGFDLYIFSEGVSFPAAFKWAIIAIAVIYLFGLVYIFPVLARYETTPIRAIKTAYAMNGGKDRHTKITNKGAIEIATNPTYTIAIEEAPAEPATATAISTISAKIAALDSVAAGDVFNEGDFTALPVAATVYTNGTQYFSFTEVAAPSIKIESGAELKLGGILDFGSSFNFGETDNGVEFQYKLTKKNAEKDCGIVKVVGVNNHATNNLTVEGVTIAPGQTGTIAQCSMLDIIKLVNYMKTNNQGPWAGTNS